MEFPYYSVFTMISAVPLAIMNSQQIDAMKIISYPLAIVISLIATTIIKDMIGPKTVPWGTPDLSGAGVEDTVSSTTCQVL